MTVICPTITAYNPHQYREQIERVAGFVRRVHIDLMDGVFAPASSPGYKHTWWPKELSLDVDIHLMYENPLEAVEYLVGLRPELIILHAEADHQEVDRCLALLASSPPIKRGLAILPQTNPMDAAGWLKQCDHCLVFSGSLGHFGGQADLGQLGKITAIKGINPNLEISWDGGINDTNAAQLIDAGVDVLNVGGFIQKSAQPEAAYDILQQIAETAK